MAVANLPLPLVYQRGVLELKVGLVESLEMEALIRCPGLLHLLDYHLMFMVHDPLLPQMKYQAVVQRKGKRIIACNQPRKVQSGLLCEIYLIVLFTIVNVA